MLILAYRPFPTRQPYAETGPIFLCAGACTRHAGQDIPAILRSTPEYLMKAYDAEDRIIYGTGAIIAAGDLPACASKLLNDQHVAYLHVRSAHNNCYQFRIDR